MTSFEIEYLEWDSAFFSLNIYRLISSELFDSNFLVDFENFIIENNVDLVYFESKILFDDLFLNSNVLEAKLVDKKTTYEKTSLFKVMDNFSFKTINDIEIDEKKEEIINLAHESGIYSRFKIDTKFSQLDYERLYEKWILNSLNREIAKEIIFYEIDGEIAGLVTLGAKNEIGDIGIIAVNKKHRGLGIAGKMMSCAENWFFENDYSNIQVVTQGNNLPAKSLYESCNFNLKQENYFYHIWKIK